MKNEELRNQLSEGFDPEDAPLFFDNLEYDDAIVGQTTEGAIVYSYEKMIPCAMEQLDCDEEEAEDFSKKEE